MPYGAAGWRSLREAIQRIKTITSVIGRHRQDRLSGRLDCRRVPGHDHASRASVRAAKRCTAHLVNLLQSVAPGSLHAVLLPRGACAALSGRTAVAVRTGNEDRGGRAMRLSSQARKRLGTSSNCGKRKDDWRDSGPRWPVGKTAVRGIAAGPLVTNRWSARWTVMPSRPTRKRCKDYGQGPCGEPRQATVYTARCASSRCWRRGPSRCSAPRHGQAYCAAAKYALARVTCIPTAFAPGACGAWLKRAHISSATRCGTKREPRSTDLTAGAARRI